MNRRWQVADRHLSSRFRFGIVKMPLVGFSQGRLDGGATELDVFADIFEERPAIGADKQVLAEDAPLRNGQSLLQILTNLLLKRAAIQHHSLRFTKWDGPGRQLKS